ncbi:MAG: hypothetical protein V4615_04630 [Bacteroidota bacterium]
MILSDLIGFAGVAILLVAFLLNLLKVLDYNNRLYISLNIVGAGLACAASVMINYMPFIILEGTWTLVSVVALMNGLRKR